MPTGLRPDVDVAILGAGAAGIAAARICRAAGLSLVVIEARERIGGRAVTVPLRGHPVDLGAHWLHNGAINPVVALAEAAGAPLRRAAQERHLLRRGRPAEPRARREAGAAYARMSAALARAAQAGEPAIAKVLPFLGPWRVPVTTVQGLLGGRPPAELGPADLPPMAYGDNFFLAGGIGAFVARLARGLPVRLGTPALRLDWSGPGLRVDTAAGTVTARAAVVAIPPVAIARGGLRFAPALPKTVADAIAGFRAGTYEHVVLHWPGAPFRGRDRLASLIGTRRRPPGLLTRIDGTAFHYFELDHATAAGLRGRDDAARFARAVLAEHFGPRALAGLAVPAVTDWRSDPLACGSWAVVGPGGARLRDTLAEPVAERIWFVGEHLSATQPGTVGGAFAEGERAARALVRTLSRPSVGGAPG